VQKDLSTNACDSTGLFFSITVRQQIQTDRSQLSDCGFCDTAIVLEQGPGIMNMIDMHHAEGKAVCLAVC
jgi:hypothetical protein